MVHHDGSLLRSGETAAGSILCFNLHSLPRYPSFSHSLPLYPSQHGSITRNVYADRNGLAALALPFYASSRCHFVLQVTDTPVSPLVATYAKMRIQGFEPSFGREYRVARFPDASGMSLRAEGCAGQWCRHAARLGCMLAASRSVAGIVLAYLGDDGQTKIAEVFVESSWTTLQKLRWFEMGETILIHVSARVDQPEHELGRRCGCGKT